MKYKLRLYLKYYWSLWAKALGEKAVHQNDRISDKVAMIRTCIILLYIIANVFIIAGVIRHW